MISPPPASLRHSRRFASAFGNTAAKGRLWTSPLQGEAKEKSTSVLSRPRQHAAGQRARDAGLSGSVIGRPRMLRTAR